MLVAVLTLMSSQRSPLIRHNSLVGLQIRYCGEFCFAPQSVSLNVNQFTPCLKQWVCGSSVACLHREDMGGFGCAFKVISCSKTQVVQMLRFVFSTILFCGSGWCWWAAHCLCLSRQGLITTKVSTSCISWPRFPEAEQACVSGTWGLQL